MNPLKPDEILQNIIRSSEIKAEGSFRKLAVLALLAGVYIAFEGVSSNTAAFNLAGNGDTLGLSRLVSAAVFTAGLIIVVLAGAELFTGNTTMTAALLDRKITVGQMLRNWVIVYIFNLAGSVLVAVLVFYSGLFHTGGGTLGAAAVTTAIAKVSLPFGQAFIRGVLCNWLVCLAVWMTTGADSTIGKIWAAFFPIMLFVVAGYEHSVAKMYFISAGILASSCESVAPLLASADLSVLTWKNMFLSNLLPVTLGNIVGGAVCVAGGYWLALKEK